MRQGSLRVIAGAIVLGCAGAALGQTAYYSHYKQHVPLVLNDQVVALYRAPELGPPSLPASVSPNAQVKEGYLPGWYFIEVAGGATRDRVANWASTANSAVLPVFKDRYGAPLVFSDRINVRFNEGVAANQAEAVLRSVPNRGYKRLGLANTYQVTVNERDGYRILEIANNLAARQDVRFATPSSLLYGKKQLVPNDPYFDRQWAFGNVGAYPAGWGPRRHLNIVSAWDITTGNPAIKILLLDDGVQLNHPDIPIANADDFLTVGGTGAPQKNFDVHGTLMAGLISARINNAAGVAGVAPGCSLVVARVHESTDFAGGFVTTPEAVSNGLIWGMGQNCRISNNSNTYGATDPLIEDTYFAAKQAGMAHFAAAGNDGGAVGFPADLEFVAAVASTTPNGGHSPESADGEEVLFCAPGSHIITTDRTGNPGIPQGFPPAILSSDRNYVLFDGIFNGTSAASAYAAGIGALILSVNPTLSPEQLFNVMASTATDLVTDVNDPNLPDLTGRDDLFGFGLLHAARALSNFLLQSISANPNPVRGGLTTRATVTLSAPTTTDLTYTVRSENESVIPANGDITIATGDVSGNVQLETRGVDAVTPVTLHVDAANLRRSVVVNVLPAVISRLALVQTSVFGGEPVTAQVDLSGRAGPSGSVVILTDNSPSVNPPSSVRVPAQQNRLVFTIPTSRTTTTHVATIQARQGATIFTRNLTVRAVFTDIATFTLNPTTVSGGTRSTGTITMTNPAPAGGAQITFSDNSTVTSMVNSITIPQNGTTGTVQVNTGPVSASAQSTIRATYLGVSKTATLTITPTYWVTNLTVTPSFVRGGFPAVGRIEIFANAPAAGVPVSVTDTNSYASTPLTVVVPAGRNWVEFPITTFPTQTTVAGDVRASYGGVTKVAPLTVYK